MVYCDNCGSVMIAVAAEVQSDEGLYECCDCGKLRRMYI